MKVLQKGEAAFSPKFKKRQGVIGISQLRPAKAVKAFALI
jgi:hypothetical protein